MATDKLTEKFLLKTGIANSFKGSDVLNQLKNYKQLLQQFNRGFNLYSRASGFSLDTLFIDSLMGAGILKSFLKTSSPVLDIGSGNGFPGIVCAIMYPETPFVLCERSLKKTEFLKHCIFQLNCSNATVLFQEANLLNNKFTRVLSKETASIKTVLQVLEKVLAPQGQAFLWKNPEWKSQWPKKTSFSPETIKTYEIQKGRKRVLLKIQRSS